MQSCTVCIVHPSLQNWQNYKQFFCSLGSWFAKFCYQEPPRQWVRQDDSVVWDCRTVCVKTLQLKPNPTILLIIFTVKKLYDECFLFRNLVYSIYDLICGSKARLWTVSGFVWSKIDIWYMYLRLDLPEGLRLEATGEDSRPSGSITSSYSKHRFSQFLLLFTSVPFGFPRSGSGIRIHCPIWTLVQCGSISFSTMG